jgi:hypothetical protein
MRPSPGRGMFLPSDYGGQGRPGPPPINMEPSGLQNSSSLRPLAPGAGFLSRVDLEQASRL